MGIAIVNGKLSHVVVAEWGDVHNTEVTLGEAAEHMRETIETERNLLLDVETTGEEHAEFLQMVEAVGSKN